MERFCKRYVLKAMSLVIVLIIILFTLQVFPQESQVLRAEGTTIINDGPFGESIRDYVTSGLGSINFAITEENQVYAWGSNKEGQLGNGETGNSTTPKKVLNSLDATDGELYLSNIKSIFLGGASSSGKSCAFAVSYDGDLYAWGDNEYGNLGLPEKKIYNLPVKVTLPLEPEDYVTSVSISTYVSVALTKKGDVYVVGRDLLYSSKWIPGGILGMGEDVTALDDFTKIENDADGNKLPPIKEVASTQQSLFLLSKSGQIYSSGWFTGNGIASGVFLPTLGLRKDQSVLNNIERFIFIPNSGPIFVQTTDGEIWTSYYRNENTAVKFYTPLSSNPLWNDPSQLLNKKIDDAKSNIFFISDNHQVYYIKNMNSYGLYQGDAGVRSIEQEPYSNFSKWYIPVDYQNAKRIYGSESSEPKIRNMLTNNGGVFVNGEKMQFGSFNIHGFQSDGITRYISETKYNDNVTLSLDPSNVKFNNYRYDILDLITGEREVGFTISAVKNFLNINLTEGERLYKKYEIYENNNKSEGVFSIVVDLYKKAFTLNDISDSATYSLGQSFTIPTYNGFTENTVNATLSKDGGEAITYSSGTEINEVGSYVLTASDLYGNSCSYTFTIVDTPTPSSLKFTPSIDGELVYGNTITKKDQVLGTISMLYSDDSVTTDFASLTLDESETRFELQQNELRVVGSDLNAGEYSVLVNAIDQDGLSLSYTITFTIQKATQSMDWNSDTKALQEISYGDEVTLGVVDAIGDVTYGIKEPNVCVNVVPNTGVVELSCIPEAKIVFTASAGGDGNHEGKIIELSVSVIKGNQTMIWNETSMDLATHGLFVGDEVQLGVKNQAGMINVAYKLKLENSCITIDASNKIKATCIPDPNSVTVIATPSGDEHYTNDPIELNFIVKKYALIINVQLLNKENMFSDDVSINLGDTLPTQRIYSDDENFDLSILGEPEFVFKKDNVEVSKPNITEGIYTVSAAYPSGSPAENYDITWNTATLRVDSITIDENNVSDYFTLTSDGRPYTQGTWTNKAIIITPVHDTFNQMSVGQVENKTTNAYTYNVEGSETVKLSFYNSDGAKVSTTVTLNYDKTAPTISKFNYEEESGVRSFLRTISFDHFFGKAQQLSFTGSDETGGSGLDHYRYEIVELDKDKNELPASKKTGTLGLSEKVSLDINTSYRISAWAIDTAGNESDEKIERVFLSDEVAQLNITATSEGKNYDGTTWTKSGVSVTLSSTSGAGVEKYQYSSDGVVFHDMSGATITLPDPISDVDNVTYTFKAIHNDRTESEKTLNLKVDTVKPELNIARTVNGAAYDGSLVDQNIEIAMNQTNTNISGTTYYYTTSPSSKDSDPTTDSNWKRYTTPMTHSANGTFTYYFKAISGAGIASDTEEYTVKLAKKEYTNITVNVTSEGKNYSPGNWAKVDITFTLSGGIKDTTQITGYEYTTTNGSIPSSSATWKPVTNKTVKLTESIKDQTYWFRVTPVDPDGSMTSVGAIMLDVDTPEIPVMELEKVNDSLFAVFVNNISFGQWMNKQAKVTITSHDETSDIAYYEVEETSQGETKDKRSKEGILTYDDGSNVQIKARACDLAGNCSSYNDSETIMIDRQAPQVIGVKDEKEYKQYYLPRFIEVTDLGGSGIAQATYQYNKEEPIDIKGVTKVKAEGAYLVQAMDEAGNETLLQFKIVKLPDLDTEITGSDETKILIDQINKEYEEIVGKIDEIEKQEYIKWIDEAKTKWQEKRIKVIETKDKSAKVEGIGDITFDPEAKLVVEKLSDEQLPALPRKAKYAYDVYLQKAETAIQPIGNIKVYLPYTEAEDIVVYAYDEDGNVKEITVQIEDGFVTFTTDRLMKYAIANKAQEEQNNHICVVGPDGVLGTEDDVCVSVNEDNKQPEQQPDGSVLLPDGGTIHFPNGEEIIVSDGGIIKDDGTVVLPDGTMYNPDGTLVSQKNPDNVDQDDTVLRLYDQGVIVEAIEGSFSSKDIIKVKVITEKLQSKLNSEFPSEMSTYETIKGYEIQYYQNGKETNLNQKVNVILPAQGVSAVDRLVIQSKDQCWSLIKPNIKNDTYTYETQVLGNVGLLKHKITTNDDTVNTTNHFNLNSNQAGAKTSDHTSIVYQIVCVLLSAYSILIAYRIKKS